MAEIVDYQLNKKASLFLKHNFPETKDLCKHFLTLVAGALVFSLTFSEKIVQFPQAAPAARSLLFASWSAMLLAIILCGTGLTLITLAAGDAVYSKHRIDAHAQPAYMLIVAAGSMFVLGLILLISAAFFATDDGKPAAQTTRTSSTVTCTCGQT